MENNDSIKSDTSNEEVNIKSNNYYEGAWEVNEENKLLFEASKLKHIEEGGKCPNEFAVTELIKQAIVNKSYHLYRGQGRNEDDAFTKKFDVVVWFTWARDPEFMVCLDNEEGDQCDLYNCNKDGQMMTICK